VSAAVHQGELVVQTRGRGTLDLTAEVARLVAGSGVTTGLATAFVHHTSASLILCENADPEVRRDLERWLARAVPDGDPLFATTPRVPTTCPRTCAAR
jgi:secondary thiamine-phosphate synthase enzyme